MLQGKITVKSDGLLITSQLLKGDNPYLAEEKQHKLEISSPQGTYSALTNTVAKLKSLEAASTMFKSNDNHIFLGHKLLFLLAQSHMNDSL